MHTFQLQSGQRQHHLKCLLMLLLLFPGTLKLVLLQCRNSSTPWANCLLYQKVGISVQSEQISSCANTLTQKELEPWPCGEQFCLQTLSVPKSRRLHSLAAAVPASHTSHDMFVTCLFPFPNHCPVCRLCHYEHIGCIGKIMSPNLGIIYSNRWYKCNSDI